MRRIIFPQLHAARCLHFFRLKTTSFLCRETSQPCQVLQTQPSQRRRDPQAVNLGEQKHPSAGQCQQTLCECISSVSTMAVSAPSSRPSLWVGDTLVALAKHCGDAQLAVPTLTLCECQAQGMVHGAQCKVLCAWRAVHGALPPAALQLLLLQMPGN